jgi:hypothetical protein
MAKTSYCVAQIARYGPVHNQGNRYWGQRNDHEVAVIDQGGDAITIKVRHLKDVSDLLTDYFAGSYAPNIKRAIKWAGW